MKNNYLFIYKQPKRFLVLMYIYIILFIILISYIFSSKLYSKKKLTGVVNENQIVIQVNASDAKTLLKSEYIKINNKKYNLSVLEISELYNNGKTNLQDVIIKFNNKNYINNQIVDITFYYEYDYVIRKIVRGVLK